MLFQKEKYSCTFGNLVIYMCNMCIPNDILVNIRGVFEKQRDCARCTKKF